MPSSTSTALPSPRQARQPCPVPFVSMPPPQSFDHHHHHHHHQQQHHHHSGAQSNNHSRPHSPSHYRASVLDVQNVLYGGRGRDREEISQLVDELYDTNATFENPLTLAKGKRSIKEMFNLLALVPGAMHSELGEVAEAQTYDGIHLAIMQHTLHIAFMPFLDPQNPIALGTHSSPQTPMNRSYSFFSLPTTPHAQLSPPAMDGHGIFSKTHPANDSPTSTTKWPLQSLLGGLSPRSLAKTLTTVHIKLHTTLVFNQHGKVIVHEDTWGLKELVEGVFPIVGTLYALHRQGMAFLGGVASRMLLGRSPAGSDEEADGAGGGLGGGFAARMAVGGGQAHFHGSSLKYGIGPDGKFVDYSAPGSAHGDDGDSDYDHGAGSVTPNPPSLDHGHDGYSPQPGAGAGAGGGGGLDESVFPAGSPMSTRKSSVSSGVWMPGRLSRKHSAHQQQQHTHHSKTQTDSAGALGLDTGELVRELKRQTMGAQSERIGKERVLQRERKEREREEEETERANMVTTTMVDPDSSE